VNEKVDCQVFQDQLDALVAGELTDEGAHSLQSHALACPDCAMLLKVKEHLSLPSLDEIAASVPWEHVEGMWSRVQAGISGHEAMSRPGRDRGRRLPWLAPTLAAASVALLFSTGFLFSELRRSSHRETELAQRIGDLEQGLADLGARTDWMERTASLGAAGRRTARAVDFMLAGRESLTVADLQNLLGRYPRDLVVLEASRIQELTTSNTPPPPELREILSLVAQAYSDLGGGQGLRAGDLQEWLEGSDLPPDMVLPKGHLLGLLSRTS